jgi:hypothetical protein
VAKEPTQTCWFYRCPENGCAAHTHEAKTEDGELFECHIVLNSEYIAVVSFELDDRNVDIAGIRCKSCHERIDAEIKEDVSELPIAI